MIYTDTLQTVIMTLGAFALVGISKFCFVWVEALRPSQRFFSHVGTEGISKYILYRLKG